MDVVNLLWEQEKKRLGAPGAGFEPARPVWSGEDLLRGVNYNYLEPVMDNNVLNGFFEYCLKEATEETCKYYVEYLKKPLDRNNSWSVSAYRKYVKYLFSINRISWEQLQHYNAYLKTSRNKEELRTAVDESLIIEYVNILRRNNLEELAILLLGGSRLSHIIYMLNNYKPNEKVKHPTSIYEPRLYCTKDFCRYYLGIKLGAKHCNYIYYPATTIKSTQLNYNAAKKKIHKLGIQSKIFRRYTNQKLEELAYKHNIRLDAVNLILSRELSITGTHYLNTRDWADNLFTIYVKYLREKILT
ncbi:MAG: hypothetical protein B6U89_04540 [Desulfurococcales archaeon ex4484_58]|nr:MAG: hypothetical protein B6U89_04540 [Desulfurococcales archaeon ex4484_58]